MLSSKEKQERVVAAKVEPAKRREAIIQATSRVVTQEPLHEWQCPNCGAVTRARMADNCEQ